MSTVFIVQQPRVGPRGFTYDVSPALQYGQIRIIFDAAMSPADKPKKALAIAQRALSLFDPRTDFLAWAGGDPAGLAIVVLVVAERCNGEVPWLKWERRRTRDGSGFYTPVLLPTGKEWSSDDE